MGGGWVAGANRQLDNKTGPEFGTQTSSDWFVQNKILLLLYYYVGSSSTTINMMDTLWYLLSLSVSHNI